MTMTPLILDASFVSLESCLEVVVEGRPVQLSRDPDCRSRLEGSLRMVEEMAASGRSLYGVTTGVGDSVDQRVQGEDVSEMPRMLARMHGCGMGEEFSPLQCRAILFSRLLSLARGYSGLRIAVLETMCDWLNADTVPRIPQEGSVGASGDLTPLSYIAACLMGEREMWREGQRVPSSEIWEAAGKEPFALGPKETLGIMNGTSAMSGVSLLTLAHSEYLAHLTCILSGWAVLGLLGNPAHYEAQLMELKAHPGQAEAAAWIRRVLPGTEAAGRLQDPYSFRCSPQVIGVLLDQLPWMRQQLETELNGVNDNPVLDAERQRVYHGGHFYGGHMSFLNDSLKTLLANLADLLDRQMAVLLDPKRNQGLPANLSGSPRPIYHGLKALQVAQSSFTAELLKLCMPASVFSRSTECHNQDKVSMGTHSARDAMRAVELLAQVCAVQLVTVHQAFELRVRQGELDPATLPPEAQAFREQISELCPFIEEDLALEDTLRSLQAKLLNAELKLPGAP